jgi:hypothetical protein
MLWTPSGTPEHLEPQPSPIWQSVASTSGSTGASGLTTRMATSDEASPRWTLCKGRQLWHGRRRGRALRSALDHRALAVLTGRMLGPSSPQCTSSRVCGAPLEESRGECVGVYCQSVTSPYKALWSQSTSHSVVQMVVRAAYGPPNQRRSPTATGARGCSVQSPKPCARPPPSSP